MSEKEFIKLIKKKREDMLLLQKDIAKKIPISKSTYSKLENENKKLNFFLIKRISEILDIDLNSIKSNEEKIFLDID